MYLVFSFSFKQVVVLTKAKLVMLFVEFDFGQVLSFSLGYVATSLSLEQEEVFGDSYFILFLLW